MIIESQISIVQQEVELLRKTKLKDETQAKEDKNEMKARLMKAEKGVEVVWEKMHKQKVRQVMDLGVLMKEIEEMRGPFMNTLNDAQKENEVLQREIGRTQTINRDITLQNNQNVIDACSTKKAKSPTMS